MNNAERITQLEQQVATLTEALKLTFAELDKKVDEMAKVKPLFPDWVEKSVPPVEEFAVRYAQAKCNCGIPWPGLIATPPCPRHWVEHPVRVT